MKKIIVLLLLLPLFTNAQSIIITSPIDTICSGSYLHFSARAYGVSSLHYQWRVNSATAGTDSSGFTALSLNDGDTVTCLLLNGWADTVLAVSNRIIVTVEVPLTVLPITGDTNVCVGTTITLSDATPAGFWSVTNKHASVAGGVLTGLTAADGWGEYSTGAADTVAYNVKNSCGTVSVNYRINVLPQPNAYFYLGYGYSSNQLCVGQLVMVNGGDGAHGILYSSTGNVQCYGGTSVIGRNPGNDYIYCIDSNYCGTDTSGQAVTVIDIPKQAKGISDTAICVGDTLLVGYSTSLTHNNNSLYQFINGYGYSSGVIGIASGIDTVYITSNGQCGTFYSSAIITVKPSGRILAYDTACLNTPIMVDVSGTGGVLYNSTPDIASLFSSWVLTPLKTGIVSLSYTLGTCTTSKKIQVYDWIHDISGPASVCRGGIVKLEETFTGGTWLTHDLSIANIDTSGSVSGVGAGVATITYRLSGCMATYPVTVYQPQIITGEYNICKGSAMQLTPFGGWRMKNDSSVAKISYPGLLQGVEKGVTILLHTSNSGCIDTSLVTVSSCDVPVSLFPNPASNRITLHVDRNTYFAYELLDAGGKALTPHIHLDGEFADIDVHLLPPGEYLVLLYGYSETTFGARFRKE